MVEIKNDEDAIALARIALWRNLKSVCLYILHRYDHVNGVILIETEPIIEGNGVVREEYAKFVEVLK